MKKRAREKGKGGSKLSVGEKEAGNDVPKDAG